MVNLVGKGVPFRKAPLEGGKVMMLTKGDVQASVQNLLDAPAVWAAFGAEPFVTKDSDGKATVQTSTADPDGWAIYEDVSGAIVGGLVVTSGATQRAVANSDCAASKHMQWIATVKTDGTLNIASARQQKITGSLLTILYPEESVWDAERQLYPFIFTSDSAWNVDVCAEVPVGYQIVGAYNENGDLITDSSCTQTFVTGETKVVAFEVVDIGSPEPVLGALLTVEHEGKVTEVDVEVPGVRSYVDASGDTSQQPAQSAGSGGGGGTLVWPAVAALAGVSVMLLGGIFIWRRRRV